MPRFFFHLKDGQDTLLDAEGIELDDAEAARHSALVEARNIISHEALKGTIDLTQCIEVLDSAGALICALEFSDAVEVRR